MKKQGIKEIWLKRYLPKSLFGRFLLIIIVPTIVVQLVATYMFYERHWSGVRKHMIRSIIGDITYVSQTLNMAASHEVKQKIQTINNALYLKVLSHPNTTIKNKKNKIVELNDINKELKKNIRHPFTTYYINNKSDIAVDITLKHGTFTIIFSKKRITNPSTYIFILWMSGTALVLLIVAILFMRTQIRSIIRLSKAAEKFGRGVEIKKFKPEGAKEVRMAAEAFIGMKERIKKQIAQRTEMLAGVSHDLKTPITRIKLQLAMMHQSKEIKELQSDITDMEKMIQGYINFVKGAARESTEIINVTDIIRSITSSYRKHHQKIECKLKSGLKLSINKNGFKRAITNVIDNALKYSDTVFISTASKNDMLILKIGDDGPGIPAKKRELVFKPFYRIDQSRNVESASTGLGLSITRDIITRYGGEIKLLDSPHGGLEVLIKLPLEQ